MAAKKIQPASPLQVEVFKEELEKRMAELEANMHKLEEASFARSLVEFYNIKEFLSPKQLPWAAALWNEVMNAPTYAEAEAIRVFAPQLLALFKKAEASKIAWPRLRYWPESFEGDRLDLYVSERSAHILIQRRDKTHTENLYLGKIDERTGEIHFQSTISDQNKSAVLELLENPVETLAVNGRKVSNCCFCGLGLENAISVAVGYGPICAGKWGLPW